MLYTCFQIKCFQEGQLYDNCFVVSWLSMVQSMLCLVFLFFRTDAAAAIALVEVVPQFLVTTVLQNCSVHNRAQNMSLPWLSKQYSRFFVPFPNRSR